MVIRIGHRGAMGYAPENTLKSIQKALELKCDIVELDVRTCRSGEVICLHDERLEKTTNGKGYVSTKSYQEIKKLDAGEGEKVPTLRDALDCIDRKAKVNLDVKTQQTAAPLLKIINEYVRNKRWSHEDFLLSSFMRKTLKNLHRHNPKVPLGVLVSYRLVRLLEFAQSVNARTIHLNLMLVSPRLLRRIRRKGLRAYAWTANMPSTIQKLKDMEIDGIFSDFPDRV